MTVTAGARPSPPADRRMTLTDEERNALSQTSYHDKTQQALSYLIGPFEEAYLKYTIRNAPLIASVISEALSDFAPK